MRFWQPQVDTSGGWSKARGPWVRRLPYPAARRWGAGMVVLALGWGCHSKAAPAIPATAKARVTLPSVDGDVTFVAELALTPQARTQGLMHRKHLRQDHAMVFVFPRPGPRSFWMKNTLIPLDMIFADADGTIRCIIHDAEPLTETARRCTTPTTTVVEINGGLARTLHLKVGQQLQLQGIPEHSVR